MIILLNYLADPYGIFNSFRIENLNKYKPDAKEYLRLSKPYHINYREPEILLLGTSKVARGLPCNLFDSAEKKCYNAGLPGATPHEIYRSLQQQLITNSNLETVYLGLDYEYFILPERDAPQYKDNRFSYKPNFTYNSAYPKQFITDQLTALTSLQTTRSSLKTININIKNHNANDFELLFLSPDGSWRLDISTHRALAKKRQERSYRNIYRTMVSHIFSAKGVASKMTKENMIWLKKMIEISHDYGIELHLFFNTNHSLFWYLTNKTQHWEKRAHWKHKIVNLNNNIAKNKGRKTFRITDFRVINDYNTIFPSPQNHFENSPWFDDILHYTPRVGKLMAEDLQTNCKDIKAAYLGSCITTRNIQANLKEEQLAIDKYISTHEKEISLFTERVRNTRPKNKPNSRYKNILSGQ
jgi:hypothetical protein